MGLLDDAIREHLELKRTRGADPSEVLRQEREALGASGRPQATVPEGAPVARERPTQEADLSDEIGEPIEPTHGAEEPFVDGFGEPEHAGTGDAGEAEVPAAQPPAESDEAPEISDPGQIALEQETAEVDMGAMLGVDGDEDVVGPIEERVEFEQEISSAHDEDEPWGPPPEPTGV